MPLGEAARPLAVPWTPPHGRIPGDRAPHGALARGAHSSRHGYPEYRATPRPPRPRKTSANRPWLVRRAERPDLAPRRLRASLRAVGRLWAVLGSNRLMH